ncbi:transcriptional regulator [Microbacterium sp.]|uniref:transcriptional regulator n=1 Tax=Microbacterium sp. TaxID=51671 RepID=UPI0028AAC268|nr:transcriptional regulator [Microbacterium sp.]
MPEQPPRQHPRLRLDDSFASPIRFSLMAALGDDLELDFATLGSILQVSDSALSKAISALEAERYVQVRRGRAGSRPRTWVAGTAEGRHAFQAHLDALRAIVEFGWAPAQSDQSGQPREPDLPGQPDRPGQPGEPGPVVAG